jgi:quercetin dioxygenase-like cupin family protein
MTQDVRLHFAQVEVEDLPSLITRSLPDQGAIEVQRDVPGKEHFWHQHDTDETLVVLDGNLRFYWDQGERVCAPGDVISLPAGMQHGSEALESGATYLIAFHRLAL